MNSSKEVKRLSYIDSARALLMIFVIIGHIYYGELRTFLYSFHVMSFFIITGLLTDPKKINRAELKPYLLKKAKTLLVPYFFMDLVVGICQIFIDHISVEKVFFNTFFLYCNAGAAWFLPTMFATTGLLWLFYKIQNKVYRIIASVLCIAIALLGPINHMTVAIYRSIIGCIFVLIGIYLKKYYKNPNAWLSIIMFIATLINAKINGPVELWDCEYGNQILFIAGGVTGAYFVMGLSKALDCRLLNYIGQNTIIILGTHQLLIKIGKLFLNNFSISNSTQNLFILLIVILGEIILIPLSNREIPELIGKTSPKDCIHEIPG